MTIDELLAGGGPCDITLWIKPGRAQANVREPGSDGWSCHTEKDAATALRKALKARPKSARRPADAEIDDLI